VKGGEFDKEYSTLGKETGGGDEGRFLSDAPVPRRL